MIKKFKKVVVLAPHTDDGELGCGGAISRLISEGAKVFYFAFSTASKSVPSNLRSDILKDEVMKATKALKIPEKNVFIYDYEVRKLNFHRQEILEDLIQKKIEIKPDLVFLPSPNDIHQDHATISAEGLRAFKNSSILGYELIWNNLTFNTTCFIKLDKNHISEKVKALGCYKSQKDKPYMQKDFIFSLAKSRGVQIGANYAESFEVLRWVI